MLYFFMVAHKAARQTLSKAFVNPWRRGRGLADAGDIFLRECVGWRSALWCSVECNSNGRRQTTVPPTLRSCGCLHASIGTGLFFHPGWLSFHCSSRLAARTFLPLLGELAGCGTSDWRASGLEGKTLSLFFTVRETGKRKQLLSRHWRTDKGRWRFLGRTVCNVVLLRTETVGETWKFTAVRGDIAVVGRDPWTDWGGRHEGVTCVCFLGGGGGEEELVDLK